MTSTHGPLVKMDRIRSLMVVLALLALGGCKGWTECDWIDFDVPGSTDEHYVTCARYRIISRDPFIIEYIQTDTGARAQTQITSVRCEPPIPNTLCNF